MSEEKTVPHWRDEKNAALAEAKKKDTNDQANPIDPTIPATGSPGHWRYRKTQNIKHGTTGTDNYGKKPEVKKPEIKKPAEVKPKYSYDELKALNKARQVELINELGGKEIPKYEDGRIKLILKLQK